MKRTLTPIVSHGEREATVEIDSHLPIVVFNVDTREMGVCVPADMPPAITRELLEFALSAILASLEKLTDAEYRQ